MNPVALDDVIGNRKYKRCTATTLHDSKSGYNPGSFS